MTRRRKTTTPNPPMKWVDDLQKIRLFGRASISFNIDDPVVVYPETLSNQAFTKVNSPPHSTYGNIPKMNDSIHARTIVTNPSFMLNVGTVLTKMNGNAPTISVMMKLIIKGPNPVSLPYRRDTPIDNAINRALTRSALPTLTDMALIFIMISYLQFLT